MLPYEKISQLIKTRKTIYPNDFEAGSISREEIEEVLSLAAYAPSHKKTYPWRFSVYHKNHFSALTDDIREAMEAAALVEVEPKLSKITEKLALSEAIALIGIQFNPGSGLPEWEEVAAVSMAVQNIWLSCTARNIGTYWSSPSFLVEIGLDIGFGPEVNCLGIMYFGKYNFGSLGVNPGKQEWSKYAKIIW
jgi:nitroreductase